MVLQFGGASGYGYLSVEQREAANEALKTRGQFKGGMFTYVDEQGQQQTKDGSEACFEHATGRKLEFAPPRYEDVIVMNPSAYAWLEAADGVAVKWLAAFTERNARIGFVRLDQNAVYNGGLHPSIEILFQTKGRTAVNGREYGSETGYEFLANEGPVPLRAVEQTEFLCMVLPTF
jgi:hypothetical protein